MEINCPLFGGALESSLPCSRKDVSELREIPDNQEVFIHPQTDQSLIVEIMELQHVEDDHHAARDYFQDLADTNAAHIIQSSNPESISPSSLSMSQCQCCILITGQQSMAKFKDTAENLVEVYMAMFRLPQFTTDILVSLNNPLAINSSSSSHGAAASDSSGGWSEQTFKAIIKSLVLKNEGLFG